MSLLLHLKTFAARWLHRFQPELTIDGVGEGCALAGIAVHQEAPGRSVVVFVADSANHRVVRWTLDPVSLRPYGPPATTSRARRSLTSGTLSRMIAIFVIAIVLGVLAAILPARRATKVNILEAIATN